MAAWSRSQARQAARARSPLRSRLARLSLPLLSNDAAACAVRRDATLSLPERLPATIHSSRTRRGGGSRSATVRKKARSATDSGMAKAARRTDFQFDHEGPRNQGSKSRGSALASTALSIRVGLLLLGGVKLAAALRHVLVQGRGRDILGRSLQADAGGEPDQRAGQLRVLGDVDGLAAHQPCLHGLGQDGGRREPANQLHARLARRRAVVGHQDAYEVVVAPGGQTATLD